MAIISDVKGGVCASIGFKASGVHSGIKKAKKDLAIIASDTLASAAAVFTTNRVKAAPVLLTKEHLANGKAQAIIVNSGNANACCPGDRESASLMSLYAAEGLGLEPEDIIVASTGVIGKTLNTDPVKNAMGELVAGLKEDCQTASEAIMTTDTFAKEAACEFMIGESICHIGGIAKGSGMIHPNMATMLVFITSDVNIGSELLFEILSEDTMDSFNMITVDGDTSTNDMAVVLANGRAGNSAILKGSEGEIIFRQALSNVTRQLCKMIAMDGEGATKLLSVKCDGASSKSGARAVAKAIASSNLVKTAMYGQDANWGRVICAAGYSGVEFDPNEVKISFSSEFGQIPVCDCGMALPFDEAKALEVLKGKNIEINISLGSGEHSAEAWGCDLTDGYVRINADYRS